MRCEECLLLLDEYVCGELGAPRSHLLSTHLAVCANCTSEHTKLRCEQNFYAQCTVTATPALWATVQMKIADEQKAVASFSLRGTRAWLAGAFNVWRLNPLSATAAAVILIAVSVGLLNYIEMSDGDATVDKVAVWSQGGGQPSSLPVSSPVTPSAGNSPERRVSDERGVDSPVPIDGKKIDSRADKFMAASGRNGVKPRPPKALIAARGSVPNRASSEAGLKHVSNGAVAVLASGIDTETAHHVERAQILLRSFKHWQFSEEDMAFEIGYEKQLSKELLSKNILLRADAQSRGNEETGKLLARLEPFLLDIANLQEGFYQEQVALIRERMQQEGIISSLRLF